MDPNENQSNRQMNPSINPQQSVLPTGPVTYPQGGQPVTYPPSNMPPGLFGGMTFIYVEDPMLELASCPSLLIRQEPEFLEKFSGCEQPNIYHIFGNTSVGFKYLFK